MGSGRTALLRASIADILVGRQNNVERRPRFCELSAQTKCLST